MTSPQKNPKTNLPIPPSLLPPPISPRAQRRIAIAVDLSDESAYAVNWAVQNYLRPGDAVILLHVRPTSALYGADWGSIKVQINNGRKIDQSSASSAAAAGDDVAEKMERKKLEDEFDTFTTEKASAVAQPLVDGGVPFKIHIVKDHDLKERLCLEFERLGLSAVVMGSRGFGAARRRKSSNGRLGSVSDYCVRNCICPVVVVRFPEEDGKEDEDDGVITAVPEDDEEEEDELQDGSDEHKDA